MEKHLLLKNMYLCSLFWHKNYIQEKNIYTVIVFKFWKICMNWQQEKNKWMKSLEIT